MKNKAKRGSEVKKGLVGDKEQLVKEHAEWAKRYMEAHERLVALLPPVRDVSRGEKLVPYVLTNESLAEYDRVEKEVNTALAKLHEIRMKIADSD